MESFLGLAFILVCVFFFIRFSINYNRKNPRKWDSSLDDTGIYSGPELEDPMYSNLPGNE